MEFLTGRALNYQTDLSVAAQCLADIHSTTIERPFELIEPQNPFKDILMECEQMLKVYMNSKLSKPQKKIQIRRMLDQAWHIIEDVNIVDSYSCCINTELNSTNFLINEKENKHYLIDWEKPLYGDPAQDIGHFLAPTTTFWKTDVIIDEIEKENFIHDYIKAIDGRFPTTNLEERVNLFIPVTCLRGLTWCVMAWVQYQEPGKLIVNPSTLQKLEQYLEKSFLDKIEDTMQIKNKSIAH